MLIFRGYRVTLMLEITAQIITHNISLIKNGDFNRKNCDPQTMNPIFGNHRFQHQLLFQCNESHFMKRMVSMNPIFVFNKKSTSSLETILGFP